MSRPGTLRACAISLMLSATAVAGCREGSRDESRSRLFDGTVVVEVTDAPFPYDVFAEVVVEIERIDLLAGAGQGAKPLRVRLGKGTERVDVLPLRTGLRADLVSDFAPAGSYDAVRVTLGTVEARLTDGRVFRLEPPSAQTDGIDVFSPSAIAVFPGATTVLVLDVDLAESLQVTPADPGSAADVANVELTPSLRIATSDDQALIEGLVLDDAGTPADTADDVPIGDATVSTELLGRRTSTATDADGRFVLGNLPIDFYDVEVEAEGFQPAVQSGLPTSPPNPPTLIEFRLSR